MNKIELSYEPWADFPRRNSDPEMQYMVATSARSGSTLAALLFWKTGVLGAPMEYLHLKNSKAMIARLSGGDLVKYWRALRRVRTSPNGVFGFKANVGMYVGAAEKDPKFLAEIKSDRVIYLLRQNKIAQGVSFLRAVQSGKWTSFGNAPTPIVYDYDSLFKCVRFCVWQEDAWEDMFALTGEQPLRITYERLISEPGEVTDLVKSFLQVDRDLSSIIDHVELTTPQSDATSIEWHKRFVEELERRGQEEELLGRFTSQGSDAQQVVWDAAKHNAESTRRA